MNRAASCPQGSSSFPTVEETSHLQLVKAATEVSPELQAAFDMPSDTPEQTIERHLAISRAAVKGEAMFDFVI